MDYRPERMPEADDLEELIERGEEREIKNFLALLHPADLAMLFDTLDRDLWPNVLAHLDIAHISDLMEELPDHLRDDLAELLRPDQLTDAFEEMASDDAADVITDLPDDMAQAVLASLPAEDREEVETLLKYPEDSAGGLMQMELVSVVESATVDQAVEAIRANAEEVGDLHFVYVVDHEQRLMGALSLEKLILARPENSISGLIDHDVLAVTPGVDQEEVARMFKRYDLVSLPVIDGQGRLLGRILHDDVVDVLEEEADEDILRMAGANEPELVYTNRIFKIASVRLPWLLATLGGTMLTGLLLWMFKLSFPNLLALLPFIPIIGAMGGNVGSQSAIIVVRGFATGRVDYHNLRRFLANELVISLIMGICCGLATGIIAHIWHGDTILGWTVGLSMLVAVIASAILGVLVPFLFRVIRIDPAIASGPLVTTIDDIIAIGIYYLFALLMLSGRGA